MAEHDSLSTVARLYDVVTARCTYRRASTQPGPGCALVLREQAEAYAQLRYAQGLADGATRASKDPVRFYEVRNSRNEVVALPSGVMACFDRMDSADWWRQSMDQVKPEAGPHTIAMIPTEVRS